MKKILYFFYIIITLILLPFVILLSLIHVIFRPKYLKAYKQRFSLILPIKNGEPQKSVWIHAVSVGEVNSLSGFIILCENKGFDICLSTTTPTGFETAKKNFPNSTIFYFPFDYGFLIRRFIKRIKPYCAILCEMEIWPSFINVISKKNIPLYLISGRLGDKEFRNYKLFKFFFQHVLGLFNGIFMQTDFDKNRMLKLTRNKNVKTSGSLKFDIDFPASENKVKNILPDGDIICALSTHKGEEEIILNAYKKLKKIFNSLSLVIIPRHIYRTEEIISIIKKSVYKFSLRTENIKCKSDIFIVDTIGEVPEVIPHCTLIVMGGSLVKGIGGHNLIEPAIFKKCVLCGKYMENFRDIFDMFKRKNAVMETSPETLESDIKNLLANRILLQQTGENAFNVVCENKGASKKVFDEIFK